MRGEASSRHSNSGSPSNRTAAGVRLLRSSIFHAPVSAAPVAAGITFSKDRLGDPPDLVLFEATDADVGWDHRRLAELLPRGIGWDSSIYGDILDAIGNPSEGDNSCRLTLVGHCGLIAGNSSQRSIGPSRPTAGTGACLASGF